MQLALLRTEPFALASVHEMCTAGLSASTPSLHLLTEEVQIEHGHSGAAFAGEHLGYPRFDLLPGHARGKHCQRMAQVNHVIDARAEEILGGGASC